MTWSRIAGAPFFCRLLVPSHVYDDGDDDDDVYDDDDVDDDDDENDDDDTIPLQNHLSDDNVTL